MGRVVTKQEMVDWVFKQPDSRFVNFNQNTSECDCGCIMVQFGNDAGIEFEKCGASK
jgi:hypothetical protein